MNINKMLSSSLTWVGVILLQLILTQAVTFLISMFFPGMENFPQTRPVLFAVIVGLTFSIGVFLAGWLAIKLRWLVVKPAYLLRFTGALAGAYLPLIVGLILVRSFEAGSPFFLVSILASILGFYVPGWLQSD